MRVIQPLPARIESEIRKLLNNPDQDREDLPSFLNRASNDCDGARRQTRENASAKAANAHQSLVSREDADVKPADHQQKQRHGAQTLRNASSRSRAGTRSAGRPSPRIICSSRLIAR